MVNSHRVLRILCLAIFATSFLNTTSVREAHAQEGDEKKKAEKVDPKTKYNLSPNFDPNYRPKKTPRNQKVTLDFRKAQLDEVVKMFSSVMGKNFIIADTINTSKTITIISPKAVPFNEAYRAFLAALQMNGLTVVPFGKFLKIVESKNAIKEPMKTYGERERLPNEARMVTAIIPIESSSLEEIQNVISKFLTTDATVIPYGSSLIINENAANLKRIQKLIVKLDKGDSADKVYVYKVLYSDASDIATKLEEIFKSKTASKSKAKKGSKSGADGADDLNVNISDIISDERTNQLIIVSNRSSFQKIKTMIEILDVPTTAGGQIHVKFLEFADAEQLSGTLSSLTGGNKTNTTRNARNTNRAAANTKTRNVAELLSGDVKITAHAPANALVIVASPRDYLAVENVIELLDRPAKQVYVEAIIMEIGVNTDRDLELGVNSLSGQDLAGVIPQSAVDSGLIEDTEGLLFANSNSGGLEGLSAALGGPGGALGLVAPFVSIPFAGTTISLPAFSLLLKATQTDTSINVLSTPSIQTLNNEEAVIVVGDRVPFQRGVTGGGGIANLLSATGNTAGASALSGLSGLIAPIDYEDVGITLRIKPQINESDFVRLEVDQEVSDIKAGTDSSTPTTTRRNIKTVVLVKDQSTVVIGGLIRDTETEAITKVPLLGDIPLLGILFRKTKTLKTKQNLILMLTPYIIESEDDMHKIRERKLEERQALLKLFGQRDIKYMKTVNFDRKTGLVGRMKHEIGEALKDKSARDEALDAFKNDGPNYHILGEKKKSGKKTKDSGVEFDPETPENN